MDGSQSVRGSYIYKLDQPWSPEMHGGSNVAGDAASKTFVAEEGTVNFEMTVVNENEEKLDIQYPQH